MYHSRRNFLPVSSLMPLAALPLASVFAPSSAWARPSEQSPKMQTFREKPDDPAPDARLMSSAEAKVLLEHNQAEMKDDIQKLYNLVAELKKQVDRTDSTSVLSLNLVDTANKVETSQNKSGTSRAADSQRVLTSASSPRRAPSALRGHFAAPGESG